VSLLPCLLPPRLLFPSSLLLPLRLLLPCLLLPLRLLRFPLLPRLFILLPLRSDRCLSILLVLHLTDDQEANEDDRQGYQ
jgi:hypothetical protein